MKENDSVWKEHKEMESEFSVKEGMRNGKAFCWGKKKGILS